VDGYPIVDQTASSGSGEPVLPGEPGKQESLPPRVPANNGNNSLTEMAQRDLEAALQLLAERAQYITGASGAAIALIEESEMICRASAGPSAPALGAEVQVKSSLTGESVRTRQVLRCDNTETDSRVNRETCIALNIKSVMVVPLLREQEVIGVFELLADRTSAFEDRDVKALERLAEMVQTSLEHAEAAKRALQEIAEKNEQAAAQQEQQKPEPSPIAVTPENDASETIVPAPETKPPSDTKPPETDETATAKPEQEVPKPKEIDKIKHCEACGFPVSPGRTLCVDCEAARLSGDSPAPLASSYAPAFLARFENRKEQGWLAANIYTIGTVLIVALTVVLLILRLR
jgi:putative methionine-R-sulfoxide reductase with GAF domain